MRGFLLNLRRDAGQAREVLADAEPQTYRRRPVLRAVATILMILVLLSFIPGAIGALAMLFGFDG